MVLFLAILQALAGIRAMLRMLMTAGGAPLAPASSRAAGTITALVPVLNEEHRLAPCLAALCEVGPSLGEIIVVDGGSTDRTSEIVGKAALRDDRIRFLDAAPTPSDWNGKAWNLEMGLRAANAPWIATVDADVRIGATLLDDAVARAEQDGLVALSVATKQELADAGAALLHPAFLATLVYRAGLPNVTTSQAARVQANGQVFVAQRGALVRADAFRAARDSRCEDVTVARVLASMGGRVGFYEGDAVVRMHESWRDCAANWPRSLTLRDRFVSPGRSALALAEIALAQALPLPTLVMLLAVGNHVPFARVATAIALALVAMRIGVLAGTRRAYVRPPLTYWLSPLADLPALALLVHSALRRSHVWRGRRLVTERSA